MEIYVTSWHEVHTNYVMMSYLCKSPACDPNISDNGNLKYENNFK